jgi:hypothetical protein
MVKKINQNSPSRLSVIWSKNIFDDTESLKRCFEQEVGLPLVEK